MLDQYTSSDLSASDRPVPLRVRGARSPFDQTNVAVARRLYVANDRAEAEAAHPPGQMHPTTPSTSRAEGRPVGSRVLAYADKSGATEEHAISGTPVTIRSKLEAIERSRAEYVLLTVLDGREQLHRFATEIMPRSRRSWPITLLKLVELETVDLPGAIDGYATRVGSYTANL
jgi:alkanesulfonate monooxygenase SsuD/methylene tetrahydromethanopterin reductase-like flavin-dependent oxidoreductase (luciferase family)